MRVRCSCGKAAHFCLRGLILDLVGMMAIKERFERVKENLNQVLDLVSVKNVPLFVEGCVRIICSEKWWHGRKFDCDFGLIVPFAARVGAGIVHTAFLISKWT